MNRNSMNNDRKPTQGGPNSHGNGQDNHVSRKNGRSQRVRALKERRTKKEDERLLSRPTQPLIKPKAPIPQDQVKEIEHSVDRAIHFDFTLTDPDRKSV